MIPLLVPIGLGLLGGYLTQDSPEQYKKGGGVSQDKDEITFVVKDKNGKVIFKSKSLNKTSDYIVLNDLKDVHVVSTDKNGRELMKMGGGVSHKHPKGSGKYLDLFEHYELQPKKLSKITDKWAAKYDDEVDYNDTRKFLKEVEAVGYTFDYGLDNMPYGLRPKGVKINELEGFEDVEEYADGGVVGKRIKMIQMDDPRPIEKGTMGTIIGVDGIGQYMVKWDNGRSLSVIPDEDKFEIIDEYEEEEDYEDEDIICSACNGSGEGMYDGSTCRVCGGSGVEKEKDYDRYDKGGVVGEYHVYGYLRSYDTDAEVKISEDVVAMNEDDAIKQVLNMYQGASPDSDLMVDLVDSYE